jgi:hypothetical protein
MEHKEGRLWTSVQTKDGVLVDAYDQSWWVCGGGPNTCGGCRDCMVAQAGDFVIRYDVTDEQLEKMPKGPQ